MSVSLSDLTPQAFDVLGQLFINGPTWDGDITSKVGRDELVDDELAEHVEGWTFLTRVGVVRSLAAPVRHRADQRWYRKQQCL